MTGALQPPQEFREVSLACDLVRVKVPSDWVLEDDFPFTTIFRLPDGGTMTAHALVYDNPEIEKTGDYASLLLDVLAEAEHDNLRRMMEEWRKTPGLPALTVSAQKQADDGGWYRDVWRSLEARPPLYRTVTWDFEPASKADGATLANYAAALHPHFQKIKFAEGMTDLDLAAATPELKVTSFGNSVILRIPLEWKRARENDDGTGRHCIDEPGLERWTLWVDWELLRHEDPAAPFSIEGFAAGRPGHVSELVTEGGDPVFLQQYRGDDDPPLSITTWHRIGRRGRYVVLAHFSFVVDEAQADLPELRAVHDLVGREAQRALLIPRPSRP